MNPWLLIAIIWVAAAVATFVLHYLARRAGIRYEERRR